MRYCFAAFVLAAAAGSASAGSLVNGLTWIGEATFATGTMFDGTQVGGLSGLAYNRAAGSYYGISDDRSQFNPARFYTLNVDLTDGMLSNGDVTFTGVTTLKNSGGSEFAPLSLDPEGIAIDTDGDVWISSEGDANALINPFVNKFRVSDGMQVSELSVPQNYDASAGPSGIRNNLAFETLTLAPNGRSLFTATENALKQDGPAADLAQGSPSRILRFDLQSGEPAQEYVYLTDPVGDAPIPAGSFVTNGLVDMLAITSSTFIAIERSFSTGVGNSIRLYEVNISDATNVAGLDALNGATYTAAEKTLILDLADLGIVLDNIEGLAFGPTLASGGQSLILVSDNNFSATQFTQFLAFDLNLVPAPGAGALAFAGLAVAGRRRR